MRKFLALGLLMALLIGTASAALFESGTKDAQPMVLYGKYNNTIVPIKAAADGSIGAQGEDSSVIFNVKTEYGAQGDGITLFDGGITSADTTLTSATASFTSADIGKVVTIIGAGGTNIDLTSTISSINSATSVEIADAASATVSGVKYTYGTDDTSAIQSAITAIGNLPKRYGKIFFPAGIYIVNGQFTAGTNTSQLALPSVCNADAAGTSVKIILEGPFIQKHTNPYKYAESGAIIYSTRQGTLGTQSILSGKCSGSTGNQTELNLEINNLTFRTVQNPVNSGLDLIYVNAAVGNNLVFDTAGLLSADFPLPTTSTSYGLRMPGGLNSGVNYWSNIVSRGFYNGISVGEHGSLEKAIIMYSVNAIVLQPVSHGSNLGYIGAEHNINIIKCLGAHRTTIAHLDWEHNNLNGWESPVYDIDDASSQCYGSLFQEGFGLDGTSSNFVKRGGTNIAVFSTTARYHGGSGHAHIIANTAADSSTSGGSISVGQDDSTATNNGSRLGLLSFFGSKDTTNNPSYSAAIAAYAAQLFTTVAAGTDLAFFTTPLNSLTRAERMRILYNGNVGIGNTAPSGMLVVDYPSAQTIASGNTISDDACGSLKLITAAGAVTTDTTNTFTAPAAGNKGCIMHVCNTGANNITLDNNAKFKSAGGADVVMTADDCVTVGSTGASGVWYQLTALEAN